jgi:hypothetical protein
MKDDSDGNTLARYIRRIRSKTHTGHRLDFGRSHYTSVQQGLLDKSSGEGGYSRAYGILYGYHYRTLGVISIETHHHLQNTLYMHCLVLQKKKSSQRCFDKNETDVSWCPSIYACESSIRTTFPGESRSQFLQSCLHTIFDPRPILVG